MRSRARVAMLVMMVFAGVLAAQPAKACSCMMGDPRDQLAEADAGMVGEFVAKTDLGDPDGYGQALYTFTVSEEYKADLPETIDVRSANNGAACGLEVAEGRSYGLFLYLDGEEWTSNLCSQTSPQVMRDAASPLPAPTSEGPIAMLVGGSFGDKRVMALDGNGATVGYGNGDGDVAFLSVCPGSAASVEVWEEYPQHVLAVRSLPDMAVTREAVLPLRDSEWVTGLYCRDGDASRVYVLTTRGYEKIRSRLLEVTGDSFSAIHEGSASYGDFYRGRAYLNEGSRAHRIVRVDLDTGAETAMVAVTGNGGRVSVSPDGQHLAVATYDIDRDAPATIVLIDTARPYRTSAVSTNKRGFGRVEWVSDRKVALLSQWGNKDSSRVYNLRLRLLGAFGNYYAQESVVIDGVAFGVAYGALLRAELPGGPATELTRLPSPVTYAIEAVP